MQVLMILSQIWKSGADIYLDKKDDRIAISKQELIPAEVMQLAEQNFQSIDDWFKSWKNESAKNITLMKMIHQICGWQHNQKLHDWLCTEEDSLLKFDEWMIALAKNGWKDIYEDYRPFQNGESNKLAEELYNRAITYATRANKEGVIN